MLIPDKFENATKGSIDYLYLKRIYAHGELHDILGMDVLYTDSIKLYNEIYSCYHVDEVFTTKRQVDYDGNVYSVNMYLWHLKEIESWQGLVCLEDDFEANKYAKECQTDKTKCI